MNREQFGEQVLNLESALYHAAKSILRNDEDCADALQNGILKAWQKLDTLRDDARFRPWLTRIVVNECYQLFRTSPHHVPLDEYPGWDAAAAEEVRGESEALLALARLEEKYRLPIVLHVIEGYSQKETGEILGLTEANVKSRILRGKRKLRAMLEKETDKAKIEEKAKGRRSAR